MAKKSSRTAAKDVRRGQIVSPSTFKSKDGEVVRDVTIQTTVILHLANGSDERYDAEDMVTTMGESDSDA